MARKFYLPFYPACPRSRSCISPTITYPPEAWRGCALSSPTSLIYTCCFSATTPLETAPARTTLPNRVFTSTLAFHFVSSSQCSTCTTAPSESMAPASFSKVPFPTNSLCCNPFASTTTASSLIRQDLSPPCSSPSAR